MAASLCEGDNQCMKIRLQVLFKWRFKKTFSQYHRNISATNTFFFLLSVFIGYCSLCFIFIAPQVHNKLIFFYSSQKEAEICLIATFSNGTLRETVPSQCRNLATVLPYSSSSFMIIFHPSVLLMTALVLIVNLYQFLLLLLFLSIYGTTTRNKKVAMELQLPYENILLFHFLRYHSIIFEFIFCKYTYILL